MDVRTYRADTLQEALWAVREELGPRAAVLQTREIPRNWLSWLTGKRMVEVVASGNFEVASRFDPSMLGRAPQSPRVPIEPRHDQASRLESLVEQLHHRETVGSATELPGSLFEMFTDLIDAEMPEDLARDFIERLRAGSEARDLDDAVLLEARLTRMIEDEILISGPIRVLPNQRRLIALVGPTGVGKTTTIAKLAANFHLRDRKKVGLITVDTYRIAAVEQLRTYADIIDLPMEVVTTTREMREAVAALSDMEVILMDTAGRSPRDEVKIQELKSMLHEARADEVHLVLSSVASLQALKKTAEQFECVGVTSIILTKLDEATGLGNLVPMVRNCRLPLSYVTNGQNVPDDIAAADRRVLARAVLGNHSLEVQA